MAKRVRTRITVPLTKGDDQLLTAIAKARGLNRSAAIRELIRAADPERSTATDDDRPAVATREELLELLTKLARDGDRQAIKDLARMLNKPDPETPEHEGDGDDEDPAARFRRAMKGGGLKVVTGARA